MQTDSPQAPTVSIRPSVFARADETIDIDQMFKLVDHIEALGLDGVFVGDRMLAEAPASGKVVYSATMIETTTLMAAIAARTTRVRIGVLVYVVPYRHPVQIAKTFASLDVISQGRMVMGAGVGWNPKEFELLGIDMSSRGSRFEEAIPVVRRLWAGERVSHQGRWWQFDDVQIAPASPRPEGLPIWIASFAPSHSLDFSDGFPRPIHGALERVGRVADGWVPLTYSASAKRRISAEHLGQAWDIIAKSATKAGRAATDVEVAHSDWVYILEGAGARERCQKAVSRFFTGNWEEACNTYLIGSADEVAEKLFQQTSRVGACVSSYVLTPLSSDPEQLDLIAAKLAPVLREAAPAQLRRASLSQ